MSHARSAAEAAPVFDRARNRYAWAVVASTLFLIFAGGMVTSTGSGLAVPDWPLSYGMWFPPMVGGVFYEHGHRMIAGTVGWLTLGLTIWTARREQRVWVKKLAYVALAAVVLQAILGGMTVLFLLPTPVSVSHACLGQTFFCLLIAIAITTGRSWHESERSPEIGATKPSLRALTIATVVAVYGQLILGAVMRHTGAGLAIPDFPTNHGGLLPNFDSQAVVIHFAHRVGALCVTTLGVWTIVRIFREHRREAPLRRGALLLAHLLSLQWILAALTIWSGRAVVPTTLHVATGAAILGTSVALALRTHRRYAPRSAAAHEGVDRVENRVPA